MGAGGHSHTLMVITGQDEEGLKKLAKFKPKPPYDCPPFPHTATFIGTVRALSGWLAAPQEGHRDAAGGGEEAAPKEEEESVKEEA